MKQKNRVQRKDSHFCLKNVVVGDLKKNSSPKV